MSDGGWIDASARPPTREDANIQNCVLAWHCYDGPQIIGWWQIARNAMLVYWRPLPPPPSAYREIWERECQRAPHRPDGPEQKE